MNFTIELMSLKRCIYYAILLSQAVGNWPSKTWDQARNMPLTYLACIAQNFMKPFLGCLIAKTEKPTKPATGDV